MTTPHDVIYLNSFFDPICTLWTLLNIRLGRIPLIPVILASRGELAESALVVKRWKKYPFLAIVRKIGFYRNVIWQASSEYERNDIIREIGEYSKRYACLKCGLILNRFLLRGENSILLRISGIFLGSHAPFLAKFSLLDNNLANCIYIFPYFFKVLSILALWF